MSYQLTANGTIKRLSDGASIPADEQNGDYREFLRWKAEGNEPLPVDPPREPTPLEKIAALERTEGQGVYVRGVREFMLGMAQIVAMQGGPDIMQTPGMQKVKSLDDQIKALRAQI